ncbi:MAG: undecaprenyl-diphosphate phosphatase, partial [Victivallaceae bacterium]|nr:undecaprenyl-diphosphate phosphatase [Victivallaceae bacterium]
MTEWIYVVTMGAVQGLTEFLPVSSSGHLALLGALFGLREDASLALGILLHAGSLLAICTFYFKVLLGFLRRDQLHLALMVIAGSIPAGAVGMILKSSGLAEELFGNLMAVGICFLITATLLRMTNKPALIHLPADGKPTGLKKISLGQSLIVGAAQAFAILPGVSRSGSTIAAGVLCGIDREAAGTFSFLLAIPAIAGATLLELRKLCKATDMAYITDDMTLLQLVTGPAISAVVSFGALALLMK